MDDKRVHQLLFADDDLIQEPELVVHFEQEGFYVETATTGLGAYKLIQEKKYDAVVLDNMMGPGRDDDSEWSYEETGMALYTGLLVLEKMAEMKQVPPVWILTALPDTAIEIKERGFSFVVDYISKPYDLGVLARKIKKYLGNKNV